MATRVVLATADGDHRVCSCGLRFDTRQAADPQGLTQDERAHPCFVGAAKLRVNAAGHVEGVR